MTDAPRFTDADQLVISALTSIVLGKPTDADRMKAFDALRLALTRLDRFADSPMPGLVLAAHELDVAFAEGGEFRAKARIEWARVALSDFFADRRDRALARGQLAS
ncbi:hypothetical protein LX81_00263 [Palleronia aestuarii]|uniref:Uncharacterized protein n=1 Tax=Palleronia aestuarii TaxID=568105 RepID=A0A2W7NHA4_9RHOB|nr:hypothetical protein [Palleronia aestuarii]PZX19801.1 hypothetical protein LX81_00263 [Palleronia aestuarii]